MCQCLDCVGEKIITSIKHDLARSCFHLWPKIGDEGDKILSPSEPILRAIIETMISPDYVLCYIPRANGNSGKIGLNLRIYLVAIP